MNDVRDLEKFIAALLPCKHGVEDCSHDTERARAAVSTLLNALPRPNGNTLGNRAYWNLREDRPTGFSVTTGELDPDRVVIKFGLNGVGHGVIFDAEDVPALIMSLVAAWAGVTH